MHHSHHPGLSRQAVAAVLVNFDRIRYVATEDDVRSRDRICAFGNTADAIMLRAKVRTRKQGNSI